MSGSAECVPPTLTVLEDKSPNDSNRSSVGSLNILRGGGKWEQHYKNSGYSLGAWVEPSAACQIGIFAEFSGKRALVWRCAMPDYGARAECQQLQRDPDLDPGRRSACNARGYRFA